MALQFNPSGGQGLVQLYERECGLNAGDISGVDNKLKEFAADVNNALDRYFSIAVQASGTWELDDTNHTDYAVIYRQIDSGVRDYTILTDANGNAILDIYKVLILPSATDTIYRELTPVDENDSQSVAIVDESNIAGIPNSYAKRSNAIHLGGAVPNYTVARGIKILVNRASSYFVYSDTTKKPGYPYHQEYFFMKPAYEYARRKQLPTASSLEKEILKLEGDLITGRVGLIAKSYSNRRKDEMDSFSGETINSI